MFTKVTTYLSPGLHSVQMFELVHLRQFSGHLLQMLESLGEQETQERLVGFFTVGKMREKKRMRKEEDY